VCRSCQLSAESIATDLQTLFGLQNSSKAVHRASWYGFPWLSRCIQVLHYITKCKAKRRMQWCKACRHWTLEQWKHVFWSYASLSGNPTDRGFSQSVWVWAVARRKELAWLHCASVKFGGGSINASVYQDILDNFTLPTLWEQFEDGPFLFHQCPKQGP